MEPKYTGACELPEWYFPTRRGKKTERGSFHMSYLTAFRLAH